MSRAGGLLRTMRWVEQQQPGLLDSSVVQQVEKLAAADDINPAVQVRINPPFTLLQYEVAAVLPGVWYSRWRSLQQQMT